MLVEEGAAVVKMAVYRAPNYCERAPPEATVRHVSKRRRSASIVFGILGFALRRANIPMVPLILGLVLGPILEQYLRQGIGAASGDMTIFITRPVSLVFLLTILFLLGLATRNVVRRMRSKVDA